MRIRWIGALAIAMSLFGGQVSRAAAETGTITPRLVCEFADHPSFEPTDTVIRAVLTYSSTYPMTQHFEAGTGQNFFSPGEPEEGQPSEFYAGDDSTHPRFIVEFYESDVEELLWRVDGSDLRIPDDGPRCLDGPLWSGQFSDTETYEADNVVGLGGSSWIATTTTDQPPAIGVPGWEPFALAGVQGPVGPQGPTGEPGPIGMTGPPGPAAVQAPASPPASGGSTSVEPTGVASATYRFGRHGQITVKDGTVTADSLVVLQYVGVAHEPTVLRHVADGRFTAEGEPGSRFRYVVYPGS